MEDITFSYVHIPDSVEATVINASERQERERDTSPKAVNDQTIVFKGNTYLAVQKARDEFLDEYDAGQEGASQQKGEKSKSEGEVEVAERKRLKKQEEEGKKRHRHRGDEYYDDDDMKKKRLNKAIDMLSGKGQRGETLRFMGLLPNQSKQMLVWKQVKIVANHLMEEMIEAAILDGKTGRDIIPSSESVNDVYNRTIADYGNKIKDSLKGRLLTKLANRKYFEAYRRGVVPKPTDISDSDNCEGEDSEDCEENASGKEENEQKGEKQRGKKHKGKKQKSEESANESTSTTDKKNRNKSHLRSHKSNAATEIHMRAKDETNGPEEFDDIVRRSRVGEGKLQTNLYGNACPKEPELEDVAEMFQVFKKRGKSSTLTKKDVENMCFYWPTMHRHLKEEKPRDIISDWQLPILQDVILLDVYLCIMCHQRVSVGMMKPFVRRLAIFSSNWPSVFLNTEVHARSHAQKMKQERYSHVNVPDEILLLLLTLGKWQHPISNKKISLQKHFECIA